MNTTIEWKLGDLIPVVVGGCMRTLFARMHGWKLETNRTDLGFDRDVMGYIVEASVGKFFDRNASPKIGSLDTNTGDLSGLQCKGVLSRYHKLIVREHDPKNFAYVLAYVGIRDVPPNTRLDCPLIVELLGWLPGAEAKQEIYFQKEDRSRGIHQAAYFVPISELRPIESLDPAMMTAK